MNYQCKCSGIVVKGNKGDGLCEKCGTYYEDISSLKSSQSYKFVIIGKLGEYLFPESMGDELKRHGHKVVYISIFDVWKHIPDYEFEDVKDYGKPMSLKWVEYKHSPDFIFIEQTYIHFLNDVKSKVIYHCREYTHHPDVLDPDLLLFEYPNREEVWKYFYKWEYTKLKRANRIDNLWSAFKPRMFKSVEKKVIDGIVDIGIHVALWRYRDVNGPLRRLEIDEKGRFRSKVVGKEIVQYLKEPIDQDKYIHLLAISEAVMLDMGIVGAFSRRAFEAAYAKTLMFIRVHNKENKDALEGMGLENGINCIFFNNERELAHYRRKLVRGLKNKEEIVKNAYKWSMNHTYEKRCEELLNLIEKHFGDKK